MAIIGTFTRSKAGYNGTIRTLTMNARVHLDPNAKSSEKSPDFRVLTTPGDVEIGAAWAKKSSETSREYLSVQLDDPSFAGAIYANLIEADEGTFHLVWSRQKPK